MDAWPPPLPRPCTCRRPARTRAQAIATGISSALAGRPPAPASEQGRTPSVTASLDVSRSPLWPLASPDPGSLALIRALRRITPPAGPSSDPQCSAQASHGGPLAAPQLMLRAPRTPVRARPSLRATPLSVFVRIHRVRAAVEWHRRLSPSASPSPSALQNRPQRWVASQHLGQARHSSVLLRGPALPITSSLPPSACRRASVRSLHKSNLAPRPGLEREHTEPQPVAARCALLAALR
jgi:hypothetical protein